MTKPLSEQVAELQELFDQVALECDQRGETIAELEDERDEWRQDAELSAVEADAAYVERDDLQRQVQEARDERDALRAKLDRANDDMEGHLLADSIVDAENEAVAATTVPSPITADELREGQTVAARRHYEWEVFAVIPELGGVGPGKYTLAYAADRAIGWSPTLMDTIVLLADAPQPTGYADDDHQDAEVLQWHEPAPRTAETMRALGDWVDRINAALRSPQLTVHALNDAPVGSWLARLFHNSRKKGDDGRWHKAWMFEGQRAETSEDLIAEGWADATLTTPEAQ